MATSSARSREAFIVERPSSSASATSSSYVSGPTLLTTAVSTNKTLLPQAGDVLSIEVQARNPRRRFPLSDEFLPKVRITSEQTDLLRRQCIIEMNRAVRKSEGSWDDIEHVLDGRSCDWRPHYTSKPHHYTLYRRRHEAKSSTRRNFTVRGQIASVSLQDLEYGLYCDTTTDERAVKTDLYRDLFLDAAVLEVFERQEDDDAFHFFGIKWLAYVSPADKFVSSRDYAVAEYSRTVVSASGEKMLVKVVVPVDTDCVPVFAEREYDLVRGAMACTYVYKYDTQARAVQVLAEGYLDPSGSATSWLTKSCLTQFAPTFINLDNCADVKHFVKHGRVLSPEAFQEKVLESKRTSAHKHCTACLKKFPSGLTARKKTHASCRCCGQVMCSRCVIEFTLCLPWHERRNAEHPSAVMDEKFCLKCVCLVRAHRNGATSPGQNKAGTPPVETPSSLSQRAAFEPVTLLEQLNFEDAPLPTQDELDEAHHHGGKRAGGMDRLRQLRERHLAKDKDRNLGMRAPVPSPVPSPSPTPLQDEHATEAFGRMEKSIAEQELLLRNIQLERERREALQREAYAQFQLQQQNTVLLQQSAVYTRSRSSTASSVMWKHASAGPRMTDASVASSAFTTASSEYYDLDDDVYVIAEANGGFELPSPPRLMRSASTQRDGTAAFV